MTKATFAKAEPKVLFLWPPQSILAMVLALQDTIVHKAPHQCCLVLLEPTVAVLVREDILLILLRHRLTFLHYILLFSPQVCVGSICLLLGVGCRNFPHAALQQTL